MEQKLQLNIKKNNKNTKRRPDVISVILSFILAVLLGVMGYAAGAEIGIFRSDIITESIDRTGYSEKVYNQILADSVELGKPMMIPEEVFQDVFDLEKVSRDIKAVYNSRIANTYTAADTGVIRQRLKDNINKYAKEQDIEMGEEQNAAVDEFISLIEQRYNSSVDISYISYYVSFRSMYQKYFGILIAVIAVLTVLDIVITLKRHKRKYRGLRYITYASLAAAIMTGAAPAFLYIQGKYRNLSIKPDYFYNMIVDAADRSLLVFMYVALFFVIVSAILIAATVVLRKKYSAGHYKNSASLNV